MAYERRRLELAGEKRPEEEPAVSSVRGSTSAPGRSGLLARLFGRRVAKGQAVIPESEVSASGPSADRRSGGYFENFANYRKSRGRTAAAVVEGKIAVHFRATHRDPERAAESFWTMFREAPRIALWAANKHPQAFGDLIGRDGPGFGWKDVNKSTATPVPEAGREAGSTYLHGREASAASERSAVRDAVITTRTKLASDRTRPAVVRSLNHLATRIEREMDNEVERASSARQVRHIASSLGTLDGEPRNAAPEELGRLRDMGAGKAPAEHCRELEADITRRDRIRAKHRGAPSIGG